MAQICKGRCERMKVSFKPHMNMYVDHVRCNECECYFKKPYPIICLCCQTKVRRKPRNINRKNKPRFKTPDKVFVHPRTHVPKYVEKEILAAVAAGRL